jgi:hypothetical protein
MPAPFYARAAARARAGDEGNKKKEKKTNQTKPMQNIVAIPNRDEVVQFTVLVVSEVQFGHHFHDILLMYSSYFAILFPRRMTATLDSVKRMSPLRRLL